MENQFNYDNSDNLDENDHNQTGYDGETMNDDSLDNQNQGMTMDLLYEESFKSFHEGDVLKGVVVHVDKEYVMVDVGAKSEGRIDIHEFMDEQGQLAVAVGDQVEALLVRCDDDDGEIILSKDKAAKIKVWDEITRIHNEDGVINGKIIARVKGGLSVDIGVTAFLPGSQVDVRPVKNLEALVGKNYDFKILKYNKRRGNVVLSRRTLLETERDAMRQETMSHLETGTVLDGVVKNLTEYGAFVDLGGLDGLLHITDMSWGRVGHPSELFNVGDTIQVKVLSFDRDKARVSLGMKQLQEDPWLTVAEKYEIGTRVSGRVVSLAEYGAFVELEKGVEGLIHVSEMSWTRKIRNPSSVLNVGDQVESVVLNVDLANKRISLGMKQVEPNPWDMVSERYPVGSVIEGKIKNITDFGIFIGIDEGIDGLVHISDMSWTKRYKHPSEVYKKGDDVRALVLAIDKDQERFSLGIKQLEEDPWMLVAAKYPVGSTAEGKITNITDFGLFIELESGVEGLIHVSESGRPKGKNLSELYKLDDMITAKVISISEFDHKIGLSVKRLKKDEEDPVYKDYVDTRSPGAASGGGTSVFGEQLSMALKASQNQSDSSNDDKDS